MVDGVEVERRTWNRYLLTLPPMAYKASRAALLKYGWITTKWLISDSPKCSIRCVVYGYDIKCINT